MTELLDCSGELFLIFFNLSGYVYQSKSYPCHLVIQEINAEVFFFFKDEMEHRIQGQ